MQYESLLAVLHDKQKLSVAELKKVERVQKTSVSESVPQLLVKLGLCSELDVADAFVESGHFEKVAPDQYPLEMQLPETVPLRFLKHYHVIGLNQNDELTVALMDPEDRFVIDALKLATGKISSLKSACFRKSMRHWKYNMAKAARKWINWSTI